MKYLLKIFYKKNYKEIMRKKELYFFIKIFYKEFYEKFDPGTTRNREVQGWDDKIIHFFIKIFI